MHDSVQKIIDEESQYDPRDSRIYESLQRVMEEIKNDLLSKLMKFKKDGKKISAYGAAAKGVTLLNYCGVGNDLIDYVVDLNPNKHGKFLPGSQIPIVDINELGATPPDILLVLPWNLSTEIKSQLSSYLKSEVKTIRAIPKVEYF